ncbi:hypothetical protein PYW08_008507 [Mythimna loreyi]|uniref:Uncharacterized protein n=1 Tax=Mythimna loreyi TaxID=667449 RepID=A0ACC2Q981_9NEOP|nr:hypothetical protein PYW08_008507 [Mythimna loreyi]
MWTPLMPLLATAALALGLAPCVVQRACPRRRPSPPSTVCMHRIPSLRTDRLDNTSIICSSKTKIKKKRIAL